MVLVCLFCTDYFQAYRTGFQMQLYGLSESGCLKPLQKSPSGVFPQLASIQMASSLSSKQVPHKLTRGHQFSVYLYKPAGCSWQTRHKANEVTPFPLSAFLFLPVFACGGRLQLCGMVHTVTQCLPYALNVSHMFAHIQTQQEFSMF